MVLNLPWITQLKKEATTDDFEISSKAQNQFWADTLSRKSMVVTVWIQFRHWSGYQYFLALEAVIFSVTWLLMHLLFIECSWKFREKNEKDYSTDLCWQISTRNKYFHDITYKFFYICLFFRKLEYHREKQLVGNTIRIQLYRCASCPNVVLRETLSSVWNYISNPSCRLLACLSIIPPVYLFSSCLSVFCFLSFCLPTSHTLCTPLILSKPTSKFIGAHRVWHGAFTKTPDLYNNLKKNSTSLNEGMNESRCLNQKQKARRTLKQWGLNTGDVH